MTRLRNDRGGILVISALAMPVFLLLVALVLDTGVWFTHKRSLQNRADAGALAAGVEYLTQLSNCTSSDVLVAGDAADAITKAAKQYGGAKGAAHPYNVTPASQDRTTVVVNADPSKPLADNTDGANPCEPHTKGDSISPASAIWTDVIARESNLSTLAGTFGVNLGSISARARVEVNQLIGVNHGGLPFVNETGDQVQCVWAKFKRLSDNTTAGILVGKSNPVALDPDPDDPYLWKVDVDGIHVGTDDDIGVEYYMGTKTGGNCDFSTPYKGAVPGLGSSSGFPTGNAAPIDWINVYNDDNAGQLPLMHNFKLLPESCGPSQVGFIYSPVACTVRFSAVVDHGGPTPAKITVSVSNATCTSNCVSAVDGTLVGTAGSKAMYEGSITFDPTALANDPSHSQHYAQVGLNKLKATWTQTSGSITTGTLIPSKTCTAKKPCVCSTASPCVGEFETDQAGNWLHAVYLADPLNSNPMVSAELMAGSLPMTNSWAGAGPDTGPFTIQVRTLGIDQNHAVNIRESVHSSGNRTLTIDCGQGNGTANKEPDGPPIKGLVEAITFGCPQQMVVNQRNNSCSPAPQYGVNPWDCINTVSGGRQAVSNGYEHRFNCSMENHWDGGSPANLSDSDPRYAYIFLTTFGRAANVGPNTWVPITGFLRVYVTGWDAKHGPESCSGDNELPPFGYDDSPGGGAQLWGHFVDVITLTDDVISGDEPCDLTVSLLTCKPQLVR